MDHIESHEYVHISKVTIVDGEESLSTAVGGFYEHRITKEPEFLSQVRKAIEKRGDP